MGRPRSIEINQLVEVLPNKQYCRCILCDKTLSGAVRSNIKRHYERLHPEVALPKPKKRKYLGQLKLPKKVKNEEIDHTGKVTKLKNRVRKCIVDWNPDVVQSLIDNVRKNENLWNPSHCFYKDRIITRNSWESVATIIEVPKSETILKWHSIRSSYRTHLKNIQEGRSGQSLKEKKTNPIYAQMSFLDAIMKFPSAVAKTSTLLEKTLPIRKQKQQTLSFQPSPRSSNRIWDDSLRKMEPIQALIAGKLISSILIQGQLGQLTMSSYISHSSPLHLPTYQLPRLGRPMFEYVDREDYVNNQHNTDISLTSSSETDADIAANSTSQSQSPCESLMPMPEACPNEFDDDTSSGNGQFESVDIGKEELCEVVHSPDGLNDSSESYIYPDNHQLDEDPFHATAGAHASTSTSSAQGQCNPNALASSLQAANDDASFLQYLSDKFGKYNSYTKYTVQYHINRILYKADMGCYDNADASKLPDSFP
ncbi:uncharacterized protein LOC111596752 isoform X1 [Drosophila hydei]|uniref:Uncharacterized protein LOC111596752 isoform X1 n=1 Tax=Drosophila hydei TaxID=7224 RepID=A0A6J1LK16_DROHY|nr:uncharacterized protein LOC111596752 isoform X1 [Drosophila hydei]